MNNVEPKNMYTMFDLIKADKGIFYWENVISYPNELVEFIEKLDKESDSYEIIPKWEPWTASDSESTIYGEKKFIVTDNKYKHTNNDLTNKRSLYIINSLLMAPEICAQRFAEMYRIDKKDINLDLQHISLNKYFEGKGMGNHTDGQSGHSNLKYSLVTYLNDDYEGGEIYFKNEDIKIKPKAGSLILFDSQAHEHEALPVIKGQKYMYTLHWLSNN